MKLRTTKAQRDGAVQRIRGKQSTVEAEARKLKVKPSAVRAWVTMAKRGTRQGRKSDAERLARAVDRRGGPEAEPASPVGSGRLEAAFRAAGVEEEHGDELEGGGDGEASSSTFQAPAPSPDELVAVCETMRGLGLRIYCGVAGIDERNEEAERLFTFTDRERETLKVWAPFAAEYVPALLSNSREVGACIFLGINVASLWSAMRRLRAMAPKPEARKPGDPFGAAAKGPSLRVLPPDDGPDPRRSDADP